MCSCVFNCDTNHFISCILILSKFILNGSGARSLDGDNLLVETSAKYDTFDLSIQGHYNSPITSLSTFATVVNEHHIIMFEIFEKDD